MTSATASSRTSSRGSGPGLPNVSHPDPRLSLVAPGSSDRHRNYAVKRTFAEAVDRGRLAPGRSTRRFLRERRHDSHSPTSSRSRLVNRLDIDLGFNDPGETMQAERRQVWVMNDAPVRPQARLGGVGLFDAHAYGQTNARTPTDDDSAPRRSRAEVDRYDPARGSGHRQARQRQHRPGGGARCLPQMAGTYTTSRTPPTRGQYDARPPQPAGEDAFGRTSATCFMRLAAHRRACPRRPGPVRGRVPGREVAPQPSRRIGLRPQDFGGGERPSPSPDGHHGHPGVQPGGIVSSANCSSSDLLEVRRIGGGPKHRAVRRAESGLLDPRADIDRPASSKTPTASGSPAGGLQSTQLPNWPPPPPGYLLTDRTPRRSATRSQTPPAGRVPDPAAAPRRGRTLLGSANRRQRQPPRARQRRS